MVKFHGGKAKCEDKLCLDFVNAFGLEWDDGWITTMKVSLFPFSHLRNFFPHLISSSREPAELKNYSTYKRGYFK